MAVFHLSMGDVLSRDISVRTTELSESEQSAPDAKYKRVAIHEAAVERVLARKHVMLSALLMSQRLHGASSGRNGCKRSKGIDAESCRQSGNQELERSMHNVLQVFSTSDPRM